jgi:hypothetical protein
MKIILMNKLTTILLLICQLTWGATYYVAPSGGDDANPGTIGSPWATWEYGVEHASAGDLVLIRGGVYTHAAFNDTAGYATQSIKWKHGTVQNPIRVYNYPGETPIFDHSSSTVAGQRFKGVSIKGCSYIIFKGLNFTGATQVSASVVCGAWMEDCNNVTFEQCRFYGNQGPGMYVWGAASENNWFHNCDFYNNYDPQTAGGNADGLDFCRITERAGNERHNKISSCRAWNNSDDGFDMVINPGYVTVDSCWSWHNGYVLGTSTPAGNGNGFKMGENDGTAESDAQRTVRNCISAYNRTHGFSQNESFVKMLFYNNIAYNNTLTAFFFTWNDVANVFRNNISLGNANDLITTGSSYTSDHNTWNGGVTVSSADFVSVDSTGIAGARTNGHLPSLDFLKLVAGSDLIDTGVDVGISYLNAAPDMGAREYTTPEVGGSGKRIRNVKQNGKIIRQ